MTTPNQGTVSERSTILRFARSLTTWTGIRRVLLVLLWPVTLVVLFYAIENWRGGRAWNAYRNQLERAGEKLDFASFVPKPVVDDVNFAAIPEIRDWFDKNARERGKDRWKDAYADASTMVSRSGENYKGPRVHMDLVAWEQAFAAAREGKKDSEFSSKRLDPESRAQAARGVLTNLQEHAELFEELRGASKKPRSVYPVQYNEEWPWAILLPHLAQLRNAAQRLQLRACAELAAGETDKAEADVQLILAVSDSLREERFLVSHLVRLAITHLAIQPVWEGLVDHRWTVSQLEQLQRDLGQRNLLPDKDYFAAEQAAGLQTIDYLQQHGGFNMIGSPNDSVEPFVEPVARITPKGWYAFEKLNYTKSMQRLTQTGWDNEKKQVAPSSVDANERIVVDDASQRGIKRLLKHRIAASLLIPAVSKVLLRSAIAQTMLDEASIACALERYRLDNKHYPATLTELVPQYMKELPHDVISGQPIIYSVGPEGGYRLWSVGWNEKDDGGDPTHPIPDDKTLDWVWQILAGIKVQD